MSFGVLTFSQDTFSGVGTINARVTLPSLGLIGAVSPVLFSGDSVVNVTTPAQFYTLYFYTTKLGVVLAYIKN